MLKLTMELICPGGEPQVVGFATIENDETGDRDTGNYDVKLYNGTRLWKGGRVENFPRKKMIGWDILCRGLHAMLGERNGISSPTKGQADTNGVEVLTQQAQPTQTGAP